MNNNVVLLKYLIWADNAILSTLESKLNEFEEYQIKSIANILHHLATEYLYRLDQISSLDYKSKVSSLSQKNLNLLISSIKEYHSLWSKFNPSNEKLFFEINDEKGLAIKVTYAEILLNMVILVTYHHGQLVKIISTKNIKIPNTSFYWYKKNRSYIDSEYSNFNDFSLKSVNSDEYFRLWSIYDDTYDLYDKERKRKGFESLKDNTYFIRRGNDYIGGACLKSNSISHIFLISPFHDQYSMIKFLDKYMRQNKEMNTIQVSSWSKIYDDSLLRLGYERKNQRRWMTRHTDAFVMDTPVLDKYDLINPTNKDLQIVSEILADAYSGSIDERDYINSLNVHEKPDTEKAFFDANESILNETSEDFTYLQDASLLLREKATGNYVACILITIWENEPLIHELGVKKSHSRLGLGSFIMKYAFDKLDKAEYDLIRLFVTLSNPAEQLYYKLGFLPKNEIITYEKIIS